VFVSHPVMGWICGAVFEGVDQSQKMEVLRVTMNFRVIAA